MRIRDWHILTNGLVRFTTDDRFNVLYKEGSFNWILQVRNNLHPHIKAGHSWPIFEVDNKNKENENIIQRESSSVFSLFLAPPSRNLPKCSICWKCGPCKDTSSNHKTISLSLFYVFHTFSHSFMPFIFLHPSADTSPYCQRWNSSKTRSNWFLSKQKCRHRRGNAKSTFGSNNQYLVHQSLLLRDS